MAKIITPKWQGTKYPGVRFRHWKPRKATGKNDKYFSLRYTVDGKQREHGLGWESDGWNAKKAGDESGKLKQAQVTGEGARTLVEKRQKAKERKDAEKALKEKKKRESVTFADIFTTHYYPQAQADKDPQSFKREKSLFKKWINPVIGTLPFKDIAPIHLEKIKKNMRDSDLSDRSIEYALAVVRQIFNFAFRNNFYGGENPVKKVKIPKSDNKRLRFLTREEAKKLLKTLKFEAPTVWEQALISLHTGLRASEIFRLTWADVNFDQKTLTAKDSKNTKTRFAYMTGEVKSILLNKKQGKPSDLLYPAPDGSERREVSRVFERVVKELGFNDVIEDRRDRVVFHSLRHSYASWLVQSGESLYVVKDRLGHSTIAMTERYSHLSPDNAQGTVKTIENFLSQPQKVDVISIEK